MTTLQHFFFPPFSPLEVVEGPPVGRGVTFRNEWVTRVFHTTLLFSFFLSLFFSFLLSFAYHIPLPRIDARARVYNLTQPPSGSRPFRVHPISVISSFARQSKLRNSPGGVIYACHGVSYATCCRHFPHSRFTFSSNEVQVSEE